MKERKIKFTAIAKKWHDKVNGNTYHSVRIIRNKDGKILACPFQYGYGDQYQQTALAAMCKAGWIPKIYGERFPSGVDNLFAYERENNYPILWTVSEGLKRDCVANGIE